MNAVVNLVVPMYRMNPMDPVIVVVAVAVVPMDLALLYLSFLLRNSIGNDYSSQRFNEDKSFLRLFFL